MAIVTMRQLLESGVHFGHQTRRWNPKMKRFILTERNGIYIIDLQQTIADIDIAFDFVKQTVAHGGTLLFVGTKKQAQEAVAEQAQRVGMPNVNHRWLGGMLTNFSTVATRLQRLKELEQIDFDDVASSGHTKKELLMMRREKDKLSRTLGGIRDMTKVPSAVWIVDLYLHQTNPDLPPQVGVFVVTDAAGKSVAHDIAMHVAAYMPAYLDRDSVPADVLDKERATLEKITLEEGKPANIVPKIVEGRLNAFYKDNCLVDQAFARDPSKSVGQVLKEAGAKVTDFVRVHVGA